MVDIDRRSGSVIGNFTSALQSVEIILTTRIGSIVMLREFGAGIAELLGRLMVPSLFVAFQTLIATAIDLWEPRFLVRRVSVTGTPEEIILGHAGFRIEVDYRPRGHHGDFTIESVRSFSLFFGGGNVRASEL